MILRIIRSLDQISSEPIQRTLPGIFGCFGIVNRPGIVKKGVMSAIVDVYFVGDGLPVQLFVKGLDIRQRYTMVFAGKQSQDRHL